MSAQVDAVVEHLFRQEAGKLASSLARAFGLSRLDAVEDIVQDTLLVALRDWSFRGIPENPTAWLHRVAKNKAIDHIRKRHRASEEPLELVPGLRTAAYALELERDLLAWADDRSSIEDSQLRMMFVCCHPGLPVESQVALTLKTLCGFSVREIASAFFTQEATIEKRLGRARKYFRDHHVALDATAGTDLQARRDAVLSSLYLLFNEGYKRTDSEGLLDRDLCLEALRLALLVTEHPVVCSPDASALVALMSLLAARFDTRTNERGEIVRLPDQDRSKWNRDLIERGFYYLARSEPDKYSSTYHLEAAIQSLLVTAASFEETEWPAILGLYRRLYLLRPSPIVAMHMSVSLGMVHGPDAAIELLEGLSLADYYLYFAILGDAYSRAGRLSDAASAFTRAIELTKNAREKTLIEARLAAVTINLAAT
ncbi:MAG: sigma-70 family RNA polymerase sigma factor [Bacteroidota bacterium]|nr:sigma-70 family RNA polymerase sigma factor [Bacteroidota bacterium]MDP4232082.1 sigma-70 family RNA polymerase sigma factor [Bacteroidota bacterium]MDP4241211.1 sigma-70 family RNA polymerase sigma factor [Bacteroidota bacterium]MDP4286603.1 sigma-70 family RNA polymerase sigma factor [Bacteroidota bacterium]